MRKIIHSLLAIAMVLEMFATVQPINAYTKNSSSIQINTENIKEENKAYGSPIITYSPSTKSLPDADEVLTDGGVALFLYDKNLKSNRIPEFEGSIKNDVTMGTQPVFELYDGDRKISTQVKKVKYGMLYYVEDNKLTEGRSYRFVKNKYYEDKMSGYYIDQNIDNIIVNYNGKYHQTDVEARREEAELRINVKPYKVHAKENTVQTKNYDNYLGENYCVFDFDGYVDTGITKTIRSDNKTIQKGTSEMVSVDAGRNNKNTFSAVTTNDTIGNSVVMLTALEDIRDIQTCRIIRKGTILGLYTIGDGEGILNKIGTQPVSNPNFDTSEVARLPKIYPEAYSTTYGYGYSSVIDDGPMPIGKYGVSIYMPATNCVPECGISSDVVERDEYRFNRKIDKEAHIGKENKLLMLSYTKSAPRDAKGIYIEPDIAFGNKLKEANAYSIDDLAKLKTSHEQIKKNSIRTSYRMIDYLSKYKPSKGSLVQTIHDETPIVFAFYAEPTFSLDSKDEIRHKYEFYYEDPNGQYIVNDVRVSKFNSDMILNSTAPTTNDEIRYGAFTNPTWIEKNLIDNKGTFRIYITSQDMLYHNVGRNFIELPIRTTNYGVLTVKARRMVNMT